MSGPTKRIEELAHVPPEVSALLSALHLSEPRMEPLTRLCHQEWASLLEFCDIAHLTLPLAQLPMGSFPCWVAERLRTNLADNAQRFDRLKAIYTEVVGAFGCAGIEYINLKGFTQAPDYVSSPRLRPQSDFDFFCQQEQVDAAQAALEAIGYRAIKATRDRRDDHVPTLVRRGDWQWRGNPFDPEMPPAIDLHFCLWNEQAMLFSVPLDEFWNRQVSRTVEGLVLPSLHPVDHLGYLALHILRNILRGEWIVNHVRELAAFLHNHAHDDLFWRDWSELHDDSLQSFEAIAFYYARAWFGCAMHAQVENAIERLRSDQFHLLSRITTTGIENMFRKNKDSVWLHMTFLASRRDRWTILKRASIPSSISPINSPAVLTRNKRRVQSNGNHPWREYIAYLISGSATYVYADLTALWHGFCWRLSRRQLSSQFWIFLAASFFFDLGFSIYYFLINLFLVDQGYTEKSLGLFAGVMAVGNLVGAVPWGRLAQRIGLRSVVLICFVLAVTVSSARALLLSFSAQLVLAFLAGVALSAWAVCLSPAVANLAGEKQRPFAFSLLFSLGIGLGALGGFAGGRFPAWFTGHHVHLGALLPVQLVLLASCSIVAVGIWPAAKLRFIESNIAERPRPLISPFLLRYLPAIAVWSLVTGSFSPLASVYLARHVHLSLPQIGNAFSLSQIAQVAAVLLAPMLFRRWGLVGGIVFTQVAAAILLLTLAASADPLAATASYICFSAFQWMNEPGLYSLLMNMVPTEARGGASASNSLVMSSSQAIAATLAGGAFVQYGYPVALRGIAVIALIAAALFWRMRTRPERESARELDTQTAI